MSSDEIPLNLEIFLAISREDRASKDGVFVLGIRLIVPNLVLSARIGNTSPSTPRNSPCTL